MAGDGDMMEGVASEAASLAGHLEARQADLPLRRQQRLARRPDDRDVHRGRQQTVRGVRLAHDARRRGARQRRRRDRRGDHGSKAARDKPTLDLLIRTTIGFGSPRAGTFAAHGEPLGADNVKKTKETFGWPTEPDFIVPDDVLAFWREARGGERESAQGLERYVRALQAAQCGPRGAARADAFRQAPAKLSWPTFNAGKRQRRDARRGRHRDERDRKELPELIGGSADLDPSTKTYLKDCGDFEPGSYAGRNVHFGVREHAMGAIANGIQAHGGLFPFTATFFNFLDYMKPAVRLAALNKARVVFVFTHDSVFLGEDGPTHEPIEQLATLRATPQDDDDPSRRRARDARSLEARDAARTRTVRLVLTRQKVAVSRRAQRRGLARAPTFSRTRAARRT